MQPEFVAKKSAWAVVSFLSILSCILIIPAIVMIFRIIIMKHYEIEFYQDKIVIKSGWLNKKKKQMVFLGITSTSVEQSLWGQLFNYGSVKVDCVGKWDVNSTTYIKDPQKLEEYLQTRIVKAQNLSVAPTTFVQM